MTKVTLGMALYTINKEAKRVLEEWGDRYESNKLYRVKDEVIAKYNKEPIDAHSFPNGTMYLYDIDGFQFHSRINIGNKQIQPSARLTHICSEDKLNLNTTQCYSILNNFLGYEALA